MFTMADTTIEQVLKNLEEKFKKKPIITASQIKKIFSNAIEPLFDLLETELETYKDGQSIFKDLLELIARCDQFPAESKSLVIYLGESQRPDQYLKGEILKILQKYTLAKTSETDFNPKSQVEKHGSRQFHLLKNIYASLYILVHQYAFNKSTTAPAASSTPTRLSTTLMTTTRTGTGTGTGTGTKDIVEPSKDEIQVVTQTIFFLKKQALEAATASSAHVNSTNDKNPLITVVTLGLSDLVESLITQKGSNPNLLIDGYSFLSQACLKQDFPLVRELLKHGANPNLILTFDNSQTTALHIACSLPELRIVQELIKYHADVTKTEPNGVTPLHVACDRGHLNTVNFLLTVPSTKTILNQTEKSNNFATPFGIAFFKVKNIPIAKALAAAGSDISMITKGDNAGTLFAACFQGQKDKVEVLLSISEIKTIINIPHKDMRYLQAALMGQHTDIARLLLEAGAELKPIASTVLMIACTMNHMDVLKFLLKQPSIREMINESLDQGNTALTIAAASGNTQMVNLLYQNGAKLDVTDSKGFTATTAAEDVKNNQMVQFLKQLQKPLTFSNNAPSSSNSSSSSSSSNSSSSALSVEALNAQGIEQYKANDFKNAVKTFETLLDQQRTAYEKQKNEKNQKGLSCLLFNLGSSHWKLENYQAALPYLQEAHLLCSNDLKQKYEDRLKACQEKLKEKIGVFN